MLLRRVRGNNNDVRTNVYERVAKHVVFDEDGGVRERVYVMIFGVQWEVSGTTAYGTMNVAAADS